MTSASLASLAERALKWSALTTLGRFVLQLGAQVALARLLGPGNYGVYGIGMAVLTFAGFIAGNGFSYSLMLQPSVGRDDIRFAFTWQTLTGLAAALAMLLSAPALAVFFDDPRIQPMLQWLSLACLLTAMSATAGCLLQRELNFRALGLVQLAAYAIGYLLVGVPLALHGWGATTLAVACVVQSAVTLVGNYAVCRHPVRPLLRHTGGGQALNTGKTVFFTNVVNWLLGNIDRVIIGRVLNAHAVGLYTLAYNLASIPNTLLVSAAQPTLLSSGAKISHDLQRLGQAWLVVLACVLVLVTPAAVVMAMLSGDLVRLLYGPAWAESAWVLALMFLCLPAWASWGLSTPVLWNTGRKHLEALLQLPLLALALPAWWLLTPGGLRSAAIVSAVVIYARAAVIVAAVLQALGLRWTRLLPFAARGLTVGALCASAVLAGQWAVASFRLPAVSLSAGTAAALAAGLLVVLTVPQLLGSNARDALSRVLPFMRPATPAPSEGQP